MREVRTWHRTCRRFRRRGPRSVTLESRTAIVVIEPEREGQFWMVRTEYGVLAYLLRQAGWTEGVPPDSTTAPHRQAKGPSS